MVDFCHICHQHWRGASVDQGVEWRWNLKKQEAFQKSKEMLLSSKVLVHFDPKLPVVLACDALSYGIGAVLIHKIPDGSVSS